MNRHSKETMDSEKQATEKQTTEKQTTEKQTTEKAIEKYLNTLTEKERVAYEIARNHLGSSFDILKSNGFLSS